LASFNKTDDSKNFGTNVGQMVGQNSFLRCAESVNASDYLRMDLVEYESRYEDNDEEYRW